jgi:hypothetical protein
MEEIVFDTSNIVLSSPPRKERKRKGKKKEPSTPSAADVSSKKSPARGVSANAVSGQARVNSPKSSPAGVSSPKVGKICFFWQEGNCKRGNDCAFVHTALPHVDRTKSTLKAEARNKVGKKGFEGKDQEKNTGRQTRGVIAPDVALALKSELFGWRSFLISKVVIDKGIDALRFVNVTDLKVVCQKKEKDANLVNLFFSLIRICSFGKQSARTCTTASAAQTSFQFKSRRSFASL